MTPKFALLGIGAAAITSVAVPVSLAKTKKTTDDDTINQMDGVFPEGKEWEEILDGHDTSFRENLDATQKLIFDQEQKLWRKHKNKKHSARYSNYFLNSKSNSTEWESNFNNAKTRNNLKDEIVYYSGGKPEANIKSAWNSNSEATYDPKNTSLNVFCKNEKDNLSRELLWELCSFFQEEPKTIFDDKNKDSQLNSGKQIGNVFGMFLISSTNNDSFWNKRQSEWKALSPNSSTYFKNSSKQIKELCREAYYKEIDSTEEPTKDEVLKYCSLDWNI